MFQEFWSKRKGSIQLLGVLMAVGAIFLGVPIPADVDAANALRNLQLGWLLIIIVGHLFLLINLFVFSIEVEKRVTKKFNFNFGEIISYVAIAISILIIWNLWVYTFKVYKVALIELLQSMYINVGVSSFIFASVIHLVDKLEVVIKSDKLFSILLKYLLSAPLLAAWVNISRITFILDDFITLCLQCYLLGIPIVILYLIYIKINARKEKKLQKLDMTV